MNPRRGNRLHVGTLKRFGLMELREALAHAAEGGQALHDNSRHVVPSRGGFVPGRERVARCAHLFDRDLPRLIATARALGLRKPFIHRLGQEGQHVDLWGKPLEMAEELAGSADRQLFKGLLSQLKKSSDGGGFSLTSPIPVV
jgi:hypothetical protein